MLTKTGIIFLIDISLNKLITPKTYIILFFLTLTNLHIYHFITI